MGPALGPLHYVCGEELLDHVFRRRALLNVMDLGQMPWQNRLEDIRHPSHQTTFLEDNVDDVIPKTREAGATVHARRRLCRFARAQGRLA